MSLALMLIYKRYELCYACSRKESFKLLPEQHVILGEQQFFAVFSCATPSKNGHRGFDYAFYLPLTTLAWQRIGFKSIILITNILC